MSALVQQASLLSGRQMVMAATVGLHALVISVLMAMRVMPDPPFAVPRIQVSTIRPEPRPPLPEPVSAPGDLQGPPAEQLRFNPDVRIPDVSEMPMPGPAEAAPEPLSSGAGTQPDPPEPAFTELGYQAVLPTGEFYPPLSRQLAEEGVTIVRVCVGPDGRLQGRPQVEAGSGSRRLDAAAVSWAREALRFTPATRDGQPVQACKGFRVRFSLQ